jgi:hypothetical protein
MTLLQKGCSHRDTCAALQQTQCGASVAVKGMFLQWIHSYYYKGMTEGAEIVFI